MRVKAGLWPVFTLCGKKAIKRDGEFLEIEDTDSGKLITFKNGKIYN